MKPARTNLRRMLLRLLTRRRGSLQAIRDVDYLTEVVRFSVLFGALVLFPVGLLALLALRSIQAEEKLFDAGLSERAASISTQVQAGLEGMFEEFELDVQDRVAAGDVALQQVSAGGLRGVFRFDADGSLVSPFLLPRASDRWTTPTPEFDQAWRRARSLAHEGALPAAADAFDLAAAVAPTSHHEAEARLARARTMVAAGSPRGAGELILVAGEFPDARDRNGHRIADLATLLRAEQSGLRGSEAEAAALLRGLLDRNLAAAWYVGLPGEVFTAELALERLQGRMDPRAWQLASSKLRERALAMHWATRVEDELRLVSGRGRSGRAFEYHPEDGALWVTLRSDESMWAFSFDYDGVRDELSRRVVGLAARVDPDLTATLFPLGEEAPEALARRSLAPQLPGTDVVVFPTDPDAMASQRRRTRVQSSIVILMAVLASALGMAAAVRVVNRELDNSRQRADFAANVSHELRSPLTQIRLKGESLQLDLVYDDDDRRAHYDAIVREAERLSRLVDNVLDFSAIERGQKRYSLRPDDLSRIVYKAAETTRDAAQTAGLAIEIDVPEDLPVVWVDRDAMGQVMTNLLSNAVKYGGDGERIRVVGRQGLEGVEVRIIDEGIGIDPEDQAKIFDHFYRVSSADVRKRRGTGIGLTIVRYIVEAHGGTISVESILGQGSTFTVVLPLEPPPSTGGA